MKINGSFFNRLNQKKGTGKLKLFKTKKSVALTVSSIALMLGIAAGSLVGCGNQKSQAPVEPTPTSTVQEQTQDQEVGTEEEAIEDAFALLADRLDISGLTMTDNLTVKVQAEVQAQLEALTPEGQTVFSPDEVYVAEDGTTWVSEEDAKEYEEKGESVTVADGYLAPDGNVWASEQDYLNYINGQNDSTVIIEGDYYTAPDGSIWTSKAEYDAYVASENGKVEIPVTDGEVVEVGDGYRAPDGSYWSSEQDYLDYIEGQKNGNVVDNTNDSTVDQGQTGTGIVEDGFYLAPDGSVWSSESDYLDYIEGMNQTLTTTSVTDSSAEETTYVEESTSSDFYMAPDGSLWDSEQDYLDFANSEVGAGETSVEVVEESSYVEEEVVVSESTDYYVDEYGNYWASYEDYLAYMEMEAGKTK